MPRKNPHARFAYDPRPVDSMVLRMTHEPWEGAYRLNITIRRNGATSPQSEEVHGLQIDDVEDWAAVVFSSLARDPNDTM